MSSKTNEKRATKEEGAMGMEGYDAVDMGLQNRPIFKFSRS